VLRWSDILEGQYGLAPGSFVGTFDAFMERVHPDDRADIIATIERANRTGADFTTAHRALWPDGTVRWLNGAGRMYHDEHGRPVRGLGISIDVTERHLLQHQYQQAQKMEAVGRLAGGVAHDFNNLLTAILGYCELLLAGFSPSDPRRDDIEEIQKASLRAASLTRQLLAFSRKQIIEPTVLDLNAVIVDMRSMLERLIGEHVQIELRLSSGLATVRADRGQIEQIVLNLAVNARDAMSQGGTLTLTTANVELDEEFTASHVDTPPGSYVMLSVRDTGAGMSEDVQSRLFEPFFTTKDVGKGTGLGLATVHGIVTQSGGTVYVDSEIGRGTCFTIYLPRAEADMVDPDGKRATNGGSVESYTVLVVEDADALRQLTKRLLERLGHSVLIARDADEARRLFAQHADIQVLLTDVIMPGESGPDLARDLLRQRPSLTVVYMSGYTEDAIVHHGILEPGIAFLHKPFSSDTLSRKIGEAIHR
jgi:PAS domain S-box-containing protein